MVFSAANYEKAFPRKDPEPVKAAALTKPIKEPGNVLEEAEKVAVKEQDPDPEPVLAQEGGDDGTE